MQSGQRLRRGTDGQLGFLVIDPETKRRSVRLDRGTKLGTDQTLVPFSDHVWQEAEEPKLAPEQLRRVLYAAERELRIVRGEYSVKQWIDLRDDQRIGWRLSAESRAALLEVLGK